MEFNTDIDVSRNGQKVRLKHGVSVYTLLAVNEGVAFLRNHNSGSHVAIDLDHLAPVPVIPAEVWVSIDTETGCPPVAQAPQVEHAGWMRGVSPGFRWVKYVVAEDQG
jgi:hypothetical protein